MVNQRLLAITFMVIQLSYLSQATTIKIQLEQVNHEQTRHRHKHLDTAVKNITLKSTTDDSKPWLNDFQLTTPLKLGSKEVTATLDSTSYITWVMSGNPTLTTAPACLNCPIESPLFKCEGDHCKLEKDKDNKDVPYEKEWSYGGRVKGKGFFATEDSVNFAGFDAQKLKIGLQYELNEEAKAELVKGHGSVGLGFGSEYAKYNLDSKKQVNAAAYDAKKDQNLSILQLINNQNSNVNQASFAIKLEEGLDILQIGEKQQYFADGEFTEYENVGKNFWALDLEDFKFGTATIIGLVESAPATTSRHAVETVPAGSSGAASGEAGSTGTAEATTVPAGSSGAASVEAGATGAAEATTVPAGSSATASGEAGSTGTAEATTVPAGSSGAASVEAGATGAAEATTVPAGSSATASGEAGSSGTTGTTGVPAGTAPVAGAETVIHPPSSHDAVFDTTTRFIWVDSAVQGKLKTEIKQLLGKECTAGESSDVLKCPCENDDTHKFPDLTFTFNQKHKVKHTIKKEDFVQYVSKEKSCFVLVRTYANADMSKALTIGRKTSTGADKDAVVLPHSFFKKNYVVFNQDKNTIDMANAYDVAPGALGLEQPTQIWTLIIGILLLLVALGALIALLKPVNYDPEADQNQSRPPQQPNQYDQTQYQPNQQQYQQPTYGQQPIQATNFQQIQYSQQTRPQVVSAPAYTGPTQSVYLAQQQGQVSPQRAGARPAQVTSSVQQFGTGNYQLQAQASPQQGMIKTSQYRQ